MKNISEKLVMIIITIGALGGLYAGFEIGQILIGSSTELRPKDLFECWILCPFMGTVTGTFIGFVFSQEVERKINKKQP